MQILSAEQIRQWDKFTIQHEPVSAVDLMERAALACVHWITNKNWPVQAVSIFCGKGNNGGDGLAMARLLAQSGLDVSVYILEFGKIGSEDFQTNLKRLHELNFAQIHFIQAPGHFPPIHSNDLVIDALFGSGLNKPLDGLSAELVKHINQAGATVVSIDLPSGLFIDRSSKGNTVICASHTLSFQCYKRCLLVQENAAFIGEVQILDIGLHPEYLKSIETDSELVDEKMIRQIFKPRTRFSHKGNYGHALIIGGSYGKIGAALLATKACLSTGAGLTSAFIPKCGYTVLQTAAPEAMVLVDAAETHLTALPDDIEKFTAIGIGPGIGTSSETQSLVSFIIRRYHKPLVIDADGLNCLALQKNLLEQLPPYSMLTPHPKEFDRLFGNHENDFERIEKAKHKAVSLNTIIVLKGHHTCIAMPDGTCYFNSTGNAGMAKGGSGDVLTGMLTSLMSQGYTPQQAALLGVYLHGWAGDFAARQYAHETMLPSHLIRMLSKVFLALQ